MKKGKLIGVPMNSLKWKFSVTRNVLTNIVVIPTRYTISLWRDNIQFLITTWKRK